jgi:hypothetical protein
VIGVYCHDSTKQEMIGVYCHDSTKEEMIGVYFHDSTKEEMIGVYCHDSTKHTVTFRQDAEFLRAMNIVTTEFKLLNYVHAASTPKPAGEASI